MNDIISFLEKHLFICYNRPEMGMQASRSESTQKKEPHRAANSKNSLTKSPFNNALVEMSWRVAVPFMVLSLGGIKLDEHLGTEPLYSLIGVFLAIAAVGLVVYRFVEDRFPGTFRGGKK